jgi:imidazolonepropionase-like amidohydrolase
VSFGLPAEDALKAITIYPAEILGVADRVGTIEVGKLANIIVTDGDPLEIRTQVKHVVIAGRDVSLDNKHLQLYTRYRGRPKPRM